jgi:hypothetical protein
MSPLLKVCVPQAVVDAEVTEGNNVIAKTTTTKVVSINKNNFCEVFIFFTLLIDYYYFF